MFTPDMLPYVFHPFHLAEQMQTEETVITALLHDVVEDTELTIRDLADMGFPKDVLEALTLLTHGKNAIKVHVKHLDE